MLVAGAGEQPALLDFFVAAPGAGAENAEHAPLEPYEVDFGGTTQVFNCGVASCGVPGSPAGLAAAEQPLGAAPAGGSRRARGGDGARGRAAERVAGLRLRRSSPASSPDAEARAEFAPGGRAAARGRAVPLAAARRDDRASRRRGAAPFTSGDIAAAIADHVSASGGLITARDLAIYEPLVREPASADYRGRRVLTNPPPSAGGILLVLAFDRLEQRAAAGAPDAADARRGDGRGPGAAHARVRRRPRPARASSSASSARSSAPRRTSRCSTARAAPAR